MGLHPKRHRYAGKLRTVKEISELTGYSQTAINKFLREKTPLAPKPQKRNPQKVRGRKLTYTSSGETHTPKEWADITGLHKETIYRYIRAGLPLETHSMKGRKKYKPPFKVKDYHFPEIGDEDTMAIACAVVQQAADDWHYLCSGGKETQDCNFVELTDFFENELTVFGLSKKTAQEVWEIMQKEREGMT